VRNRANGNVYKNKNEGALVKTDPISLSFADKYNLTIEPNKDFYIRENHWIPQRLGVQFFAFRKTLYCNSKLTALPNHEILHIAQFKKFGVARVAVHYLLHLTTNYFRTFDFAIAFRDIPFEREAREYEEIMKQQKMNGRILSDR
jgi:hypothetical protein